MGDVNILSTAAFEAISVAQATYGVPDRLIAKIAQCSYTQVYRKRTKVGWSVRRVSTAFLHADNPSSIGIKVNSPSIISGDSGGVSLNLATSDENCANNDAMVESDVDVLRAAIDRLLRQLTREMAVEDIDEIDALALKRLEMIGNAAKQAEKLVEMRCKLATLGQEAKEAPEKDPAETARVLKKIEKRVHDLAERRARDIVSGAVNTARSAATEPGMDDQRPPESIGDEQA